VFDRVAVVSTLRSVFEEYQSGDPALASDEELESDLDEFEWAADMIEYLRTRCVAEADRRGSYRKDGHLSMAAWLAGRYRMTFAAAASRVRTARALATMPATRAALACGEVSRFAARVLVEGREGRAEEFARAESTLVQAARTLSVLDLRRAVEYWRQAADPAQAMDEEQRLNEARRLHVSATLGGMVRADGDLDPETGQTVLCALKALRDAESRRGEDGRTPAQRRADALGEICRRWLDSTDRPVVAGERPHVTVTVDLESLRGRPGRRSEFDDVGPIHPETARRWACDASASRVITRGGSEPLDVGRRTPVVPAPMLRAVIVRDGECRFPGCGRPHSWCDAHHIRHWADGGPTALSNLILLCRPHHRLVHQGFRVAVSDAGPVFSRPDGSPLEDRAPP
jgi:hypothetical protein